MPRKRRNRKNKKATANNKKPENEAETARREYDKTIIPSSISITNILTPIKATPSPKINNNAVQFHRNNEIAHPTTPVNRERSFRRTNLKEPAATPNFSNINLLFNLENTCTPPAEKNRPIRVSVATQTANHVITCDVAVQSNENDNNAITETPKINQLQLLDEINEKTFANHVLPPDNVVLQNCNVNPYLKTHSKTGDVSFFTTHFYNLKTASTPIDRLNYFRKSPKNDVQALKNEILALKRCYKSASPKINHHVTYTKLCNNSHSISLLRHRSPIKNNLSTVCKRISLQEVDQAFVDSTLGARLYARVKHFGRFSAKWTLRLLELCWELGITVKKGLSAIYKYYKKDEPAPQPPPTPITTPCKCATFKAEILTLTEKIEHLTHEVATNKKLVTETQNTAEERFLRDFNELKERLNALEEMKHDVHEMKKLSCGPPPPPPPPPLPAAVPPPPPPPPPPMFNCNLNNSLKINGRRSVNGEKKGVREGATRPIISLDDILKVKLKKTSRDRSTPSLRTPQPLVSMDMLKQVKLRPASRSHTPASLHDNTTTTTTTTPSSFSTSPHSSLTRMLSNVDVNVYKVKRLKRVSPYSFDDISRRNLLARLERDRTN